jgi:hypothetical protein
MHPGADAPYRVPSVGGSDCGGVDTLAVSHDHPDGHLGLLPSVVKSQYAQALCHSGQIRHTVCHLLRLVTLVGWPHWQQVIITQIGILGCFEC